jgi:hypothetical protein
LAVAALSHAKAIGAKLVFVRGIAEKSPTMNAKLGSGC